jgi:hypothetical protein
VPPALAFGLLAATGLLQPVLVRLSILVLKSAVSLPVVVLRCRALLKLSTCQRNTMRPSLSPAGMPNMLDGVLTQPVCMLRTGAQATGPTVQATHSFMIWSARSHLKLLLMP